MCSEEQMDSCLRTMSSKLVDGFSSDKHRILSALTLLFDSSDLPVSRASFSSLLWCEADAPSLTRSYHIYIYIFHIFPATTKCRDCIIICPGYEILILWRHCEYLYISSSLCRSKLVMLQYSLR